MPHTSFHTFDCRVSFAAVLYLLLCFVFALCERKNETQIMRLEE